MTRRSYTIALLAALLALTVGISSVPAVSADSGTFTDSNGLSCSWFSFGSTMASVDCSGYSMRLGGYASYHCDYTFMDSMTTWQCRDSQGGSWSGSR